jgi:uncharacterized protein (DUF58 family)
VTLLVLGAVAIPIAYWIGRRELLYLGSFLMLLPLVALAFVRWRRLRMSVRRVFSPRVVGVGHPTIVHLEIANLTTSPTMEVTWRDTVPWRPFSTLPARLGALRPRGPRFAGRGNGARMRYELVPPLRGAFEIGPMLVDFVDPFGLATGAAVAGEPQTLIVTPDVVALPDNVVSIAADEGPTRMLQRRALGGEDDLMTREYRRGDALRRVHWRASAHHGELMVRQEEQRSHAEARIVLDTRRASYRDADGLHAVDEPESESFESAVSLFASIGLHLNRSGFLVRVIETGPSQVAPLERPDEFLESLAVVALTDGAPSLTLLSGVERPDRSQGSLFAILSDADRHTVDRLIAQRHSFDLAVAILVTPRHVALADTLRDAGWICIPVMPGEPVESVWLAVGAAQEASRARG